MEFIWNDGGRASSGFVGLAGDCVTRSIAIATGTSYRNVYQSLGEVSKKSPRDGVFTRHAATYLQERDWDYSPGHGRGFCSDSLPKGVVVAHLIQPDTRRSGHFCTIVDHVVYDTWNACEDREYTIEGYWSKKATACETNVPAVSCGFEHDAQDDLTQKEFDRILHRLQSLDSTANDRGSTEGEKRNALRMMQNLMLRHNLSREDIREDDNVDHVRFTRMACPVNGRRSCGWEKSLAAYLTREIFPMAQWYFGSRGHRTLFWIYGPVEDVRNCITLLRELLVTIATAAHLQYGGHTRGSGASYAEGYVKGLPRYQTSPSDNERVISENALIQVRTLAMHDAAKEWLDLECGIALSTSRGAGRDQQDPSAADRGKQHGAKHDIAQTSGRKRITSTI